MSSGADRRMILRELGSSRLRLRSHVTALSASRDGRRLAAGSTTHDEIVVFDLPSTRALFRVFEPTGRLVLSGDGRTLASAFAYVRVWDVDTRREHDRARFEGMKQPMAFCSATGLIVASNGARSVIGVSLRGDGSGQRVLHEGDAEIESLALSDDGEWLALREVGRQAIVALRLRDGSRHRIAAAAAARSALAFMPGSATVAFGTSEGIFAWSLPSQGPPRRLGRPRDASHLAFSPSGQRVVAHGSMEASLVETATGATIWQRELPYSESAAAFTNDDEVFVASQALALQLSAATGTPIGSDDGPIDQIQTVAVSPAGDLAVVGSHDRSVTAWRLDREHRTLLGAHDGYVYTACFSPDGSLVATGGSDDHVRLFDPAATSDAARGAIRLDDEVKSLAYSPDGAWIAAICEHGDLVIVDTATRDKRKLLANEGFEFGRLCLAFVGPRTLVTSVPGNQVLLVDIDDGRALRRLPVSRHELAADAHRLAVVDDRGVKVLSLPGLEEIMRVEAPVAVAMALGPEGELAVAQFNGDVRVHRRGGRAEGQLVLGAADTSPTALAFAPGGRLLVGTSTGQTLVVAVPAEQPEPTPAHAPARAAAASDDRTPALVALLEAFHRGAVSSGYRGPAPADAARLVVVVPAGTTSVCVRGSLDAREVILSITVGAGSGSAATPAESPIHRARRWVRENLSAEGRRRFEADHALIATLPHPPGFLGARIEREPLFVARFVTSEVPPLEWLVAVVAQVSRMKT